MECAGHFSAGPKTFRCQPQQFRSARSAYCSLWKARFWLDLSAHGVFIAACFKMSPGQTPPSWVEAFSSRIMVLYWWLRYLQFVNGNWAKNGWCSVYMYINEYTTCEYTRHQPPQVAGFSLSPTCWLGHLNLFVPASPPKKCANGRWAAFQINASPVRAKDTWNQLWRGAL